MRQNAVGVPTSMENHIKSKLMAIMNMFGGRVTLLRMGKIVEEKTSSNLKIPTAPHA